MSEPGQERFVLFLGEVYGAGARARYAVLRLASKKTMSRKKKSLAVSRVDWRRRRRDESSHEAH